MLSRRQEEPVFHTESLHPQEHLTIFQVLTTGTKEKHFILTPVQRAHLFYLKVHHCEL